MLWGETVRDAGSANPIRVLRQIGSGSYDAPEAMVYVDDDDHHLWKTTRIGQIMPDGQFNVIWESEAIIHPVPFPPTRTTSQWLALENSLHAKWHGWEATPVPASSPSSALSHRMVMGAADVNLCRGRAQHCGGRDARGLRSGPGPEAAQLDALQAHHDVAAAIYTIAGTIYAVLLAFAVIIVWQAFTDTQSMVAEEANAVSGLERMSRGFPTVIQRQLHEAALTYAHIVVVKERRLMATVNRAHRQTRP